jgi:hypothetical protein
MNGPSQYIFVDHIGLRLFITKRGSPLSYGATNSTQYLISGSDSFTDFAAWKHGLWDFGPRDPGTKLLRLFLFPAQGAGPNQPDWVL